MTTKPRFRKLVIVGVGLIGGSVGLAVKKRGLARLTVGVVRRPSTARLAVRCGAVDVATVDLGSALAGADAVVLCAPVPVILSQLAAVDRAVSKGALVMDVASSKKRIASTAARVMRRCVFVPCHPMAGSAKRGLESGEASADLFEGATCFVIGRDRRAAGFWRALGSRVVDRLSAAEHDEWVAGPSHAKHVSDCALMRNPAMRRLTRFGLTADNPAFRDAARLSKCDPDLWADILLSNPYALGQLTGMVGSLEQFRRALSSADRRALVRLIREANAVSRRLCPERPRKAR
ncbi:MAG: Cyclohexadienyl dehydrogenase [Candidatus Omnitrophica bacterium]|nr:Cyclohexadienyl dehydrogenase [Candidatus Omnitrophota bacterium]